MKKFLCLLLIGFLSGVTSNVISAELDDSGDTPRFVKQSVISKNDHGTLSDNFVAIPDAEYSEAHGYTQRSYSKVSHVPYKAPQITKKRHLLHCAILQFTGDSVAAA